MATAKCLSSISSDHKESETMNGSLQIRNKKSACLFLYCTQNENTITTRTPLCSTLNGFCNLNATAEKNARTRYAHRLWCRYDDLDLFDGMKKINCMNIKRFLWSLADFLLQFSTFATHACAFVRKHIILNLTLTSKIALIGVVVIVFLLIYCCPVKVAKCFFFFVTRLIDCVFQPCKL